MRIGIDLDNTIINYSNVFSKICKKYNLKIYKQNPKVRLKTYIRKYISKKKWTEIQGEVYGKEILNANIFQNFKSFLKFAKKNNIEITIISHKSKYPIIGKKINLHSKALQFLKKKIAYKFLKNKNIFFESSIKNKIKKIIDCECDYFIDDLLKVFKNKEFPKTTEKLLFKDKYLNTNNFNNWSEIITFFKNEIKNKNKLLGKNNESFLINKKIFVKNFTGNNLKKKFLRETIFLDFLEKNRIRLTPKLFYKSNKRNFIKTLYIKDIDRSYYSKNKSKLILESFNFIKKINSKKYSKKNFYLAKDFCQTELDYKKEILFRIKMLKKLVIYKKNKQLRNLIKKINLMFKTLVSKGFFKKKYYVNKNNLILSPCDFHIGNMIFNKKIYFIDFEYSGLDDPAKIFSIFFLQPELNLDKKYFIKNFNKINFIKNNFLRKNVEYLMPLNYLRWSLILLNLLNKKEIKFNQKLIKKVENFMLTRIGYYMMYKNFL